MIDSGPGAGMSNPRAADAVQYALDNLVLTQQTARTTAKMIIEPLARAVTATPFWKVRLMHMLAPELMNEIRRTCDRATKVLQS